MCLFLWVCMWMDGWVGRWVGEWVNGSCVCVSKLALVVVDVNLL